MLWSHLHCGVGSRAENKRKKLLLFLSLGLLVGTIFLLSYLGSWAAPSSHPSRDTVPTFTPTPCPSLCDCQIEIPEAECEALVAFYNSTNGPGWADNSGWLQTFTPCSWAGVICFCDWWGGDPVAGGHVCFLHANNNNLQGPIPPEIEDLTELRALELINNAGWCGAIPPEIGNLTKLEHLYLRHNQLSGGIPGELGNLVNLQYLGLEDNQLSGPIPPELGQLRLRFLSLARNQLSGSIPPELGNVGAAASSSTKE